MFLPNFLLKKDKEYSEIPEATITQHQNYMKLYSAQYKQYLKTKSQDLYSKVIDWLFSLDVNTRTVVCCLDNNFSSKFLFYLYKKTAGNVNCCFKILKEEFFSKAFTFKRKSNNSNKLSRSELNFGTSTNNKNANVNFQDIEDQNKIDFLEEEIEKVLVFSPFLDKYYDSCNKDITEHLESNNNNDGEGNSLEYLTNNLELVSLLFAIEIRLFNLHIFNDAIILSEEILEDRIKFCDYFSNFSFGKSFTSLPKCNKSEDLYNIELPEWYNYDNYYTIAHLYVAIFEQTIMMRYLITHAKNYILDYSISNLVIEGRLSEFFVKKNQITIFLEEKYSKDNFNDFVSLCQIRNIHNVILNDNYTTKKSKVYCDFYVSSISKQIFEHPFIYYSKNPEDSQKFIISYVSENGFGAFINSILFFSCSRINSIDNFVCYLLFDVIRDKYNQNLEKEITKVVDDNTNNANNKKAKKKKKKDKPITSVNTTSNTNTTNTTINNDKVISINKNINKNIVTITKNKDTDETNIEVSVVINNNYKIDKNTNNIKNSNDKIETSKPNPDSSQVNTKNKSISKDNKGMVNENTDKTNDLNTENKNFNIDKDISNIGNKDNVKISTSSTNLTDNINITTNDTSIPDDTNNIENNYYINTTSSTHISNIPENTNLEKNKKNKKKEKTLFLYGQNNNNGGNNNKKNKETNNNNDNNNNNIEKEKKSKSIDNVALKEESKKINDNIDTKLIQNSYININNSNATVDSFMKRNQNYNNEGITYIKTNITNPRTSIESIDTKQNMNNNNKKKNKNNNKNNISRKVSDNSNIVKIADRSRKNTLNSLIDNSNAHNTNNTYSNNNYNVSSFNHSYCNSNTNIVDSNSNIVISPLNNNSNTKNIDSSYFKTPINNNKYSNNMHSSEEIYNIKNNNTSSQVNMNCLNPQMMNGTNSTNHTNSINNNNYINNNYSFSNNNIKNNSQFISNNPKVISHSFNNNMNNKNNINNLNSMLIYNNYNNPNLRKVIQGMNNINNPIMNNLNNMHNMSNIPTMPNNNNNNNQQKYLNKMFNLSQINSFNNMNMNIMNNNFNNYCNNSGNNNITYNNYINYNNSLKNNIYSMFNKNKDKSLKQLLSMFLTYYCNYALPGLSSFSAILSNPQNFTSLSQILETNTNKKTNCNSFYLHLEKEINEYVDEIKSNVQCVLSVKEKIISYFQTICKQKLNNKVSVDIYGSFASGLSIESSDIDLRIHYEDCFCKEFLDKNILILKGELEKTEVFKNLKHIPSAKFPVIKMEIDVISLINMLKDSSEINKLSSEEQLLIQEIEFHLNNNKHYQSLSPKKQEDILQIKIDVTYSHNTDITIIKDKNNHIYKVLDFINYNLGLFPNLKEVILLLKSLLLEYDINNSYQGMLSSYCLFLLVLSVFQFVEFSLTEFSNIAEAFVFVISTYGALFNFDYSSINFNYTNPFLIGQVSGDQPPIVVDPLSQLNAAKSCYKINDVQAHFRFIYFYIFYLKGKYEELSGVGISNNNSINSNNTSNIDSLSKENNINNFCNNNSKNSNNSNNTKNIDMDLHDAESTSIIDNKNIEVESINNKLKNNDNRKVSLDIIEQKEDFEILRKIFSISSSK